MPYIAKKERQELDPLINQLAEKLAERSKELGNDGAFAGLLNYACTRLALKLIKLRFGKIRYWIIATTTGVFKNIADEFYRRTGIPYEDKQIAKNGDVDLYQDFEKDL